MSTSILIVEDEMLTAMEMESILVDEGYRIAGIATDLDEALALATEYGRIDLALVDLNLRDGFTGPQIGERLAREYRADVLFITANPRLLGDGVAGAVGVLTKPTDEAALTAAVAYALRRRAGMPAEAPPSLRRFG